MKKATLFMALYASLGVSSNALAQSAYLADINTVMGTSLTSCIICHGSATNSPADKGVTLLAKQYSGSNATAIKLLDADSDGFVNYNEANAGSDMSSSADTPFNILSAQAGLSDVVLAGSVIIGDPIGSEAAITAADFGITLGTGNEIIGGNSVVSHGPIKFLFKDGGALDTSIVHVATVAGLSSVVPSTDYNVSPDGSVNITALPAGATSATYMVERSIVSSGGSSTPAVDPYASKDTYSKLPCMANAWSPISLLLLVSIGLVGLISYRKRTP